MHIGTISMGIGSLPMIQSAIFLTSKNSLRKKVTVCPDKPCSSSLLKFALSVLMVLG